MVRCLICVVLLSATAMLTLGCDSGPTGGSTPPKSNLTPESNPNLQKDPQPKKG
jgi:hypothetical protein